MTDPLLLACMLVAWGATAVVPWRLAAVAAERIERRRGWALALLPALALGALAAYGHLQVHPDAAVVQGLYPFAGSGLARIVGGAVRRPRPGLRCRGRRLARAGGGRLADRGGLRRRLPARRQLGG